MWETSQLNKDNLPPKVGSGLFKRENNELQAKKDKSKGGFFAPVG